jgi:predicted kinase
MSQDLERALRFRNYAEELRIIAAEKSTPENRRVLRKIADDYDQMAQSFEAVDRSKNGLGPKGE